MYRDISYAASHVVTSATRFSMLAGGGAAGALDLFEFLRVIVPKATRSLDEIRTFAEIIPDDRLRAQALGSIDTKAYHVAGACILATFLPPIAADHYVEIVAPLESIYDYLDNLCDRHPDVNAAAYRVLHRAIADALTPESPTGGYYNLGPAGDDADYLVSLVRHVQRALRRLAGYELLLPLFHEAATLYGEMQSLVHLHEGAREEACRTWYARYARRYADLEWQEFACAAGSQLHVYAPLFMLFSAHKSSLAASYGAYFPAVSALHVLLDSFIDQDEDRSHGDLNFVALYGSHDHLFDRVDYLTRCALDGFERLPRSRQHRFLLRTMVLFYLTHPKVYAQGLDGQAQELLRIVDEALG